MSDTQQETLLRLSAAVKVAKDRLRGHHNELTGCRYSAVGPAWWINSFAQLVASLDQIERDLRELSDDAGAQNLESGDDLNEEDNYEDDLEDDLDDDLADDDFDDDLADDDFDEPEDLLDDDFAEEEDEEEEEEEEDEEDEEEEVRPRTASYDPQPEPASEDAGGVAALGLLAALVFGISLPS